MIPDYATAPPGTGCKPRASGDDPEAKFFQQWPEL